MARWRCLLKGNFYCAFCSSKEKHHPLKCLLLGQLGIKIIDISGQGGGGTPGAPTGTPPLAGASGRSKQKAPPPTAAAPAAAVSLPALASGSSSTPAGLMAAVEENARDDGSSLDSLRWYGDEDGVGFKASGSVTGYVLRR